VQREPQDTREIGDRFTNLENGLNLKFKKINQIKDFFYRKLQPIFEKSGLFQISSHP